MDGNIGRSVPANVGQGVLLDPAVFNRRLWQASGQRLAQRLGALLLCALVPSLGVAQFEEDQPGFTFDGVGLGEQDLYVGAFAHAWTLEPDHDEALEFDGYGAGALIGVRAVGNFTIETRFLAGVESADDADWEAEPQHALSTVGRINLDLGTPFHNEIYIMGGFGSYVYDLEHSGGDSETNAELTLAAGVGLTHRFSRRSWVFGEYFNYSVGGSEDFDAWGGGVMYRF